MYQIFIFLNNNFQAMLFHFFEKVKLTTHKNTTNLFFHPSTLNTFISRDPFSVFRISAIKKKQKKTPRSK